MNLAGKYKHIYKDMMSREHDRSSYESFATRAIVLRLINVIKVSKIILVSGLKRHVILF
jgi:hypothetical protein